MQPTIAVTAAAEGMIYINGRFAGEAGEERPLLAPVAAFGPVYLEYRPLQSGFLPSARKAVISGGRPLPDSLAGAEDLFVIQWPGNVTEIEFIPRKIPSVFTEPVRLGEHTAHLVHGERPRLETGRLSCPLPTGAGLPEVKRIGGGFALTGPADDGQYLLILSDDLSRQTGFLRADSFEWEDGVLLAASFSGDTAGHGLLERWQADEDGLRLLSAAPVRADGAPRSPRTPEEAALMAVEAALLGRSEETDSLLAPDFPDCDHPENIVADGEWCLPMKYAAPGGAPCIGLMRLEEGNLASVRPLYYRTEKAGAGWRLTSLRTEP